jgi:ankyrin repeat protein
MKITQEELDKSLNAAISSSNVDIISLLVKNGANVNHKTSYGEDMITAILVAYINTDALLQIIEILLKNGAMPSKGREKIIDVFMAVEKFVFSHDKKKVYDLLNKYGYNREWMQS